MQKINLEEQEIKKFDDQASRWWDKNGDFKSLHKINPLRSNWIDSWINVAEKEILDVGCGAGILSEAMAFRGAHVTGIDMAPALLKIARLHMAESNLTIKYTQSTIEEFSDRSNKKFDVITCMEMLEHVPDPKSVIQSTINRNFKSYLGAIVGGEYILKLLPKGTHKYSMLIKPSELSLWLRNTNFEVLDLCGLTYNPISKRFSLNNSDISINYMICAHKS